MVTCLARERVHSEGRVMVIMTVDYLKREDYLFFILLRRVLFLT
jgi:hypothetical protein